MKILTLLSLFAIATLSKAQLPSFELLPNGFVNSSDTSKSFIVIDVPSKTKNDLFKSVEMWVTKKYVSPQDVLSKVDGETITINGISKNSIHRNGMHVFDMNYTVNFDFKDGKIRINSPSFRLTTYSGLKRQTLHLVSNSSLDGSDLGIYNEKLKLKSERAKNELEAYFNKFIIDLNKFISDQEKDW